MSPDELDAELAAAGHESGRALARLQTAEIERLRNEMLLLKNALWKACGDDADTVAATIESQRP